MQIRHLKKFSEMTEGKSRMMDKFLWIALNHTNGPFALTSHMVQNPLYWWQKNVADSNTKDFQPVKLDFPLFSMSQWRIPHSFAIQYGGSRTM